MPVLTSNGIQRPFGREIARTLNEHEADIIVMDRDPAMVSQMKSEGFKFAVHLDNLEPSALAKFVKPEDVVIISLGESFEANILTIELLKEIGVRTIYSRVTRDIQYRVLEKMDITEEITRLYSHVGNFSQTLAQNGAIGKRLTFILQEMHREANTIASKAADYSISELVINIKDELEKLREQSMNIE